MLKPHDVRDGAGAGGVLLILTPGRESASFGENAPGLIGPDASVSMNMFTAKMRGIMNRVIAFLKWHRNRRHDWAKCL
jgi:hypothetical protein